MAAHGQNHRTASITTLQSHPCREFEELRAFLAAHNNEVLDEAHKRYQEAVLQAQVRVRGEGGCRVRT